MYIPQIYESYSDEQHQTWRALFQRQYGIITHNASESFLRGFRLLSLDSERIARLEDVNEKLVKTSGWSVVGVAGLVSNRDFFQMLIEKKFPVTVNMRNADEIDFSELPDIFHDIYGHVPMLLNEMYCEFMAEYSKLAIKYVDDEVATNLFGRLYWFTLETGLVYEAGETKPYGGAILTSKNEILNIKNELIPKHDFDLYKLIGTEYNSLKLQKEYFVIKSFEQLFDSLRDIEKCVSLSMESSSNY